VLVVVQIVNGNQPPRELSEYKLQELIDATGRYSMGRRRRQADENQSVYIAANLTESELTTRGFTLGDGREYGDYTNHQLKPDVRYNVGLWSQVDGTDTPIVNSAQQPIIFSMFEFF
jgi:hypothetical protein